MNLGINNTIDYYDRNAARFAESTVRASSIPISQSIH